MLKTGLKLLITALVLLSASVLFAQEEEQLFADGNRFYQNEQYELALENYTGILDQGYENGELFYNIGNTYFKLGELGYAVLYYEKAKRLTPEDEDLLTNLEVVNNLLVDKITPIPDVFYVKYWNKFRNSLSIAAWKTLFFAAFWIIAGCVSILFFSRNQFIRKTVKWTLISFSAASILILFIFISNVILDKPGQNGVVMDIEVRAYASPTETGTELFIIHEGTKVHIKRQLEDWLEVDLADGKVGWIPAGVIEII
ncbi:MAG: tetratricopeptide repeat protein [bacterium]|nr:tetratricopeptide repeat protein [bacterium]